VRTMARVFGDRVRVQLSPVFRKTSRRTAIAKGALEDEAGLNVPVAEAVA
jgi:hypothetical protein